MTAEEIATQYPYLYETHLHTKEASACARDFGADMARAHKAVGYAGIIVTDHNWGGNTCVDQGLSWREWVDRFFAGYRNAKAEGDKIGLQVFCGYEAGFNGTEFLIYGLTPQWMANHPEIRDASVAQQYQLVKNAGGMVIHAHPYREEWYIEQVRLFPGDVDGCEIVNATHSNSKSTSHNNPEFDAKAVAYAKEHDFCTTAGSDIHCAVPFGGGIAFPTKLADIQDFIRRVKGKADYVITNGEHWYTRTGSLLV